MISSIRIPEELERELQFIVMVGKEKSLSSYICDVIAEETRKGNLQVENKGWKKGKTVSVSLCNTPEFFSLLTKLSVKLKLKSRNVLVYQILKNKIKEYKNA